MERQLQQPEWLKPRDRQKLLSKAVERVDWFRVQWAAAPRSIRETFIPLLATASILEYDQIDVLEQQHLRKMLAIQADVMAVIPEGVDGIAEMRQFVNQAALKEQQQWQQLKTGDRLPQDWKNARRDAAKIEVVVAAAEGE